jgi:hypothetical protein
VVAELLPQQYDLGGVDRDQNRFVAGQPVPDE